MGGAPQDELLGAKGIVEMVKVTLNEVYLTVPDHLCNYM